MIHKRPRKVEVKGKVRSGEYPTEEAALKTAGELQAKSDRKFLVQHSMVHRDKWVIVECVSE